MKLLDSSDPPSHYQLYNKYNDSEKSQVRSSNTAKMYHSRVLVALTVAVVEKGEELISDQGQSLRTLLSVSLLSVCERTITDWRIESYTIKVRQILSESEKTKRVVRSKLLVCSLKNEAADILP